MCGIVGYVGKRQAVDILMKGLKQLEYRGYDSAGVAFFKGGKIEVRKSEGKLENVEKLLSGASGTCGIGHTRWATHGRPTTQNAHPHQAGHVVLVHNGIIENFLEIRKDVLARGHRPKSETDSELFAFLVLDEMNSGSSLVEAVRKSFTRVEGACSVVIMSEKEPGVVVGARHGSPLVAAVDPQGGTIVASDAQPLVELTRDVVFLEHGDLVVGSEKGMRIVSLESGKEVSRPPTRLDWSPEKLDKGGYPHYMLKEIYEQPTALVDTLNGMMNPDAASSFELARQPGLDLIEKARELTLVACGSSFYAALLGKYWMERWARIHVNLELASEFRYRKPVLGPGAVIIAISQSGETADTLAVVKQAKELKIPVAAITNVRGSTMSREADAVFYTSAGPEIGVCATKTFATQLLTLLLLSGHLCRKRGEATAAQVPALYSQLVRLPHMLANMMDENGEFVRAVRAVAKKIADRTGFFFMGRGYSYPMALEGALKLKEIAYIHAEGYAGGELKHGPIAMIDSGMAVVVLSPKDSWREKTVSNLEEVKARGAKIIGVGASTDQQLQGLCDYWIPVPQEKYEKLDESLLPFMILPAVQLLSYEIAVIKGTDVDKPRNLAKCVTVE